MFLFFWVLINVVLSCFISMKHDSNALMNDSCMTWIGLGNDLMTEGLNEFYCLCYWVTVLHTIGTWCPRTSWNFESLDIAWFGTLCIWIMRDSVWFIWASLLLVSCWTLFSQESQRLIFVVKLSILLPKKAAGCLCCYRNH